MPRCARTHGSVRQEHRDGALSCRTSHRRPIRDRAGQGRGSGACGVKKLDCGRDLERLARIPRCSPRASAGSDRHLIVEPGPVDMAGTGTRVGQRPEGCRPHARKEIQAAIAGPSRARVRARGGTSLADAAGSAPTVELDCPMGTDRHGEGRQRWQGASPSGTSLACRGTTTSSSGPSPSSDGAAGRASRRPAA